ncbi:cysteine desulfurase [Succinimonas amylolytica]|uniref:cysteine desulfurase n=1 Tax=Succinimonas amylolytica TaxID=83769 RepID=UPI00037784E7|nr:cysteine desulfurase [Succinimonas amylolytica]
MTITNSVAPEALGLPSVQELETLAGQYFQDLDGSILEPERCVKETAALVTSGDTAVFGTAASKAAALSGFEDFQKIADEVVKDDYAAYAGSVPEEIPESSGASEAVSAAAALAQQGTSYSAPAPAASSEIKAFSPVVVSQAQSQNQIPEASPARAESPRKSDATVGGQTGNRSIVIGSKTLEQIRQDFPILGETVSNHPLIWLDNGATTQRPQSVIDRLSYYYAHENSNVHRGAHTMAARSTDAYENARQTVADFIGAVSKDNIVFVRGTTEAINLVAHSFVKPLLKPGDEIIVSLLEHHANIVPWQLVAEETGAVIKVIPVDASGQLDMGAYEKLFTPRTRFVSVTHVSNVLGTITPVEELVAIAHAHGVRILIDGAQSIAHIPVNVTALDTDFFVFSGHKVYAPTGIGALYGKKEVLEQARPYHGGGNMIADVTFERTIYNPAPNKFEAGTGSIADAVGLGAALDYLAGIGIHEVSRYEHELVAYGMQELGKIRGLHLIGTAKNKSSALSFVMDGKDIHEIGKYLDSYGIAVRTGHHCAQPILRHYGLEGVVRPTLAIYNTFEDIDYLARALRNLV